MTDEKMDDEAFEQLLNDFISSQLQDVEEPNLSQNNKKDDTLNEAMPDEEKSMEEPAPEILPEPVFEETASSARKSAMKIYIVINVLLLALLGCMFFFVNRTRMAKEERMPNLDEEFVERQVFEDSSQCVQDDTIQLISSQTPIRGHAEE